LRRRSLLLVCALIAATAACSGGGDGPHAAVSTGRWVVAQAVLPGNTSGVFRPEIQAAIAVPGGWAALGQINGRDFAAWTSRDGVHWGLTQYRTGVTPYVGVIVKRGTELVGVGGMSSEPAVWISHDQGVTWTRVNSRAFEPDSGISGATVVRGTVVMVGSVRDGRTAAAAAWVMRDDAHIDGVTVPRAGIDAGLTGIVDLGDRLVAVGTGSQHPASWVSRDAGSSWQAVSPSALTGAGQLCPVVRLDGKLVSSGQYFRPGGDVAAGLVWQTNTDAGEWIPVARRTGSFGDGQGTRTGQLVAFRNAALMVGEVNDRSNQNFCYDDLASCDQQRAMLWLSTDGSSWGRVAVSGTTSNDSFGPIAIGADGFLLFGRRFDPSTSTYVPRVWRWIGPAAAMPASVVPPDQRFKPPGHELITRYDATLVTGRTYRFVVPVGGPCGAGRLDFNSTIWQVTRPWGEAPYATSWPVRHEQVSDAPTDYLYGTVRVVDSRQLQVGIEGGPILRTYEPTTERQPVCA
jgi:hypothetical protein